MSEVNDSEIIRLDDNSNQSTPTTKERDSFDYDYGDNFFRTMTKIFLTNIKLKVSCHTPLLKNWIMQL